MRGTILIEDYKIHCTLGVHPHERTRNQEIALDLRLVMDVSECVKSDSLKDTIDYEKIGELCTELAQNKQYHLLEAFAYDVLEALFLEFSLIHAKIRVKKKGAMLLAHSVSIEMEKP